MVVTKQPSIVGADFDPMLNGALVRVLGDGLENEYLLPAANWGALLKGGVVAGWKYSDEEGLNGPIFSTLLKDGILKLIGKGAALGHGLATEPAHLTVVFEPERATISAWASAPAARRRSRPARRTRR